MNNSLIIYSGKPKLILSLYNKKIKHLNWQSVTCQRRGLTFAMLERARPDSVDSYNKYKWHTF